MPQDPAVAEAQGFQRTDLCLFIGGDPVHGRYHRQDPDGKEQHRENGAHGLAFLRLA